MNADIERIRHDVIHSDRDSVSPSGLFVGHVADLVYGFDPSSMTDGSTNPFELLDRMQVAIAS